MAVQTLTVVAPYYLLNNGTKTPVFDLLLKPYSSIAELHREFHTQGRTSTGWAEEMMGLMPIVSREMTLRLGIITPRDLDLRGCFSFFRLAQEFAYNRLWRCPAQAGPDFWKADRPKLMSGERLRIAMGPITTYERSRIAGIFEVTQLDPPAREITLDAQAAPHQCSFDDTSRFVVQFDPIGVKSD